MSLCTASFVSSFNRSARFRAASLVVVATSLGLLTGCGDSTDDAALKAATGMPSVTTYSASCKDDPSLPFCVGAPAPSFALADFQPRSPFTGARYGLERFRGKVTVVGFLSGWCHYCWAQAAMMQKLQDELASEGHDVAFVIINSTDAVHDQSGFTKRCSFPLLQDQVGADGTRDAKKTAWQLLGGKKDDLAVYDSEGNLAAYLPINGAVNTNMTWPQGYREMKALILATK